MHRKLSNTLLLYLTNLSFSTGKRGGLYGNSADMSREQRYFISLPCTEIYTLGTEGQRDYRQWCPW